MLASVAGAESRPGGMTTAALRLQALRWLDDEITAIKAAHDERSIAPARVRMMLVPLLRGPDFASVRGDDAISKLPADEQPRWRKLWADADALLASLAPKPESR
jgi:hypothetical protein